MLSSHGMSVITSSSNRNCSPAMATCDGMYLSPPFVVAVEKEEKADGNKGDGDDPLTFLEKKNPQRLPHFIRRGSPHLYY